MVDRNAGEEKNKYEGSSAKRLNCSEAGLLFQKRCVTVTISEQTKNNPEAASRLNYTMNPMQAAFEIRKAKP